MVTLRRLKRIINYSSPARRATAGIIQPVERRGAFRGSPFRGPPDGLGLRGALSDRTPAVKFPAPVSFFRRHRAIKAQTADGGGAPAQSAMARPAAPLLLQRYHRSASEPQGGSSLHSPTIAAIDVDGGVTECQLENSPRP